MNIEIIISAIFSTVVVMYVIVSLIYLGGLPPEYNIPTPIFILLIPAFIALLPMLILIYVWEFISKPKAVQNRPGKI